MIEQIGSALFMLLIFILILYGSYICTKKVAKLSYKGGQSRYMKLEDRLVLGQEKYLAIVLVGEKHYLIGVTGSKISVLSEINEDELSEIPADIKGFTPNVSFKDLMTKYGKDKNKAI